MKTELKEKQKKARADARPKTLFKNIAGWQVLVDERNYIIRKGNKTYYFSTLASALLDISDDLEKSLIKDDLKETVKTLQHSRKELLKAISNAVHSLETK